MNLESGPFVLGGVASAGCNYPDWTDDFALEIRTFDHTMLTLAPATYANGMRLWSVRDPGSIRSEDDPFTLTMRSVSAPGASVSVGYW